ncbi:MAG: hydroxymethylbilane synthase [Acidimicrobiaceae bacterium]|nr:hydroxymethylbilane synthase [Acidimicrobiaceae bacterium]
MPRVLRLATRTSPLALAQARLVAEALERVEGASVIELVPLSTRADQHQEVPIEALGGRGVFTTEVEQAVLDGRADLAVHSAKDLPSAEPPAGLVLAAVPERADPRDAMVGRSLSSLRPGALVATGAPRRRAQLAWLRPDLGFVGLRGNIGTRLGKVPDGGAAVVALAALERLGLLEEVTEVLAPSVMLSQVGQGALALRCREGDLATVERLAAIDHPASHRALLAERAMLARLGGGCDAPVAALARCGTSGPIRLEGLLASRDGHRVVRSSIDGSDPVQLGTDLADKLLVEEGGRSLLEEPGPAGAR